MDIKYVVLICVLLGVMIGANVMCGCCKYPLNKIFSFAGSSNNVEGLENPYQMTDADKANADAAASDLAKAKVADPAEKKNKIFSNEVTEMMGNLFGTGVKKGDAGEAHEGMQNYGQEVKASNNDDVAGSWINKATQYSSNLGYANAIHQSNTHVGTPVPLPEGELFFFTQNQFKPECCPNIYSSSTGCACMSKEQHQYLNTRGGNRTSDSEY